MAKREFLDINDKRLDNVSWGELEGAPYNLGKFRAHNSKIYQEIEQSFYICIDDGPYSFIDGIRKVNNLVHEEWVAAATFLARGKRN